MAYRPFLGAPFLECWSDGNHICVQEPNGSVTFYRCALGVTTNRQVNPFIGPDAMWVLYTEDVMFVGRNDCTFSGFNQDGLLVRYGGWACPTTLEFEPIGQMDGKAAFLDPRDYRTIYIENFSRIFVLKNVLQGSVGRYQIVYDIITKIPQLTLAVSKGGDKNVEVGTWVDAPEQLRGDSPVQL